MNRSKKSNPHYWKKWRESGAVGQSGPEGSWVILRGVFPRKPLGTNEVILDLKRWGTSVAGQPDKRRVRVPFKRTYKRNRVIHQLPEGAVDVPAVQT